MNYYAVIAFLSLIIIRGTESGVAIYSPMILVIPIILYFVFKKIKLIKVFDLFLLLFSFSIAILQFIHTENPIDAFRFSVLLIYICFLLTTSAEKKGENVDFHTILWLAISLFCFEFVSRIIISETLIPSNLYDWKARGLLYNDSNFVATIISVVLISLFDRRYKGYFYLPLCLFLFLTLSRTAILGIFFMAIPSIGRKISLIILCIIVFVFPEVAFVFSDMDGSFDTKIQLINIITEFKQLPYDSLFFGLGREASISFARDAGSSYVGHNLIGLMVQSGALLNGLILFFIYRYRALNSTRLPDFFIFTGLISFLPVSLLGQLLLLYYLMVNSKNRKKASRRDYL